eukprot:386265_1
MSLEQHIQQLLQTNENVNQPVKSLLSIFTNILKHPFDSQYQRLKISKLKKQFVSCPICIEILYDAGFKQSANGAKLIFSINNMKLLKKVHKKIDKLIKTIDASKSDEKVSTKNIDDSKADDKGLLKIVGSGWCSIDNKILFIVLTFDDNLYLYNSSDIKNDRYIKNINLNYCKNIKFTDKNIDENDPFKYGLILETNENNDLLLYFKVNKLRNECIKKKQLRYLDAYETNNNDDSKQFDNMKSIEILVIILNEYDKWIKNQNKSKKSLQLSLSYKSILNHFHKMIMNDDHNDKYKCLINNDKCQYTMRHIVRHTTGQPKNHDDILHELLDKIHCFIYHKNDKNLVRDNINHKFVINTQQTDDDSKTQNNICSSAFAFGIPLQHNNLNFTPHFSSLKEELLSNPYYRINEHKYNKYYLKALQFKNSEYGKNMKAKQVSKFDQSGIKVDEPITINHIISLMIYCNETELQKIFKKHTRKLHPKETDESVYKRNKYISNWCKYL